MIIIQSVDLDELYNSYVYDFSIYNHLLLQILLKWDCSATWSRSDQLVGPYQV
jgi:hypothetical protein